MNSRTVSCLLIVIFGGLVFGFSIGYVGPIEEFYNRLSNCTSINDEDLCNWVSPTGNQGCAWDALTGNCSFAVPVECGEFYTQEACSATDGVCVYDYDNKVCQHVTSWNANEQGLIATMMILGAMLTSFVAGPIVDRLGLKTSLAAASVVNLIAGAFQVGAWVNGSFTPRLTLLLIGRFASGLSLGVSTVVCPMYVGEVAQKEIASIIGVSFQVFVTAGIAIAALLGFVVHPPDNFPTMMNVHKFHALNGVFMVLTLGQLITAWWVVAPESVREGTMVSSDLRHSSPSQHSKAVQSVEEENLIIEAQKEIARQANSSRQDGGQNLMDNEDDDNAPLYKRPRYIFMAFCLGGALQLSGINAIMAYAPKMANIIGLKNPFLANFIVMAWNFVTTIASIFLARKLDVRKSFMGGAFLAGLACFVTGIPVFPGVTDDESLRNGLIIFGILLYILIFEVAIGPSFYWLSQSVFPASIRSSGCGLSLALNFVFNAIINFGFPIAVQGLSGGVSGNQKKGFAIMFLIFGALSIICSGALKVMIGGNNDSNNNSEDGIDHIAAANAHDSSSGLSMPESGSNASGRVQNASNNANFIYGTEADDRSSPRM